ncbi:MAG TPA: phospholipid carrier-dependent glycosyltransferase [Spongiibacteraceae bacterium]
MSGLQLPTVSRWTLAVLLLLIGGTLTRFIAFGGHAEAGMDEIYFSQYVSAYFTHQFYFDTHPPLGKLLVAGFAALWNFQPVALDVKWDASFSGQNAEILRFLPQLAGAVLPAMVLLLARELGLRLRYALFAAILVLLDNALIAHSRFVYFDNFLLVFGVGGIALLWRALRQPRARLFFSAGVLLGMACAVKWTALTFVLIAGVRMLWWLWTRAVKTPAWWRYALATTIGMGVVYVAAFWLHLALLTLPGSGDNFMPEPFQQTLRAHAGDAAPPADTPGFWQNFIDMQREILRANQRVGADHPYGSQWWQWPLLWKPIYYLRVPLSADGSGDSHTYSIANGVVWLGAGLAVVFALLRIGPQLARAENDATLSWLLAAYLLSWVPFAGIHRVMFLYHYFPALLFSILIFARVVELQQWRKRLYATVALAAIAFAITAPLTYGWPIDIRRFEFTWLPYWR